MCNLVICCIHFFLTEGQNINFPLSWKVNEENHSIRGFSRWSLRQTHHICPGSYWSHECQLTCQEQSKNINHELTQWIFIVLKKKWMLAIRNTHSILAYHHGDLYYTVITIMRFFKSNRLQVLKSYSTQLLWAENQKASSGDALLNLDSIFPHILSLNRVNSEPFLTETQSKIIVYLHYTMQFLRFMKRMIFCRYSLHTEF